MNAPEIILIIVWIIELCLTANLHGTEREGKYSFWEKLINIIIVFFFLRWAGLFQ